MMLADQDFIDGRGENHGKDSSDELGADSNEDLIEFPIDGTLDLHIFRPSEVKTLVPNYLEECLARGILQVRIVHGKGIGALRETVHAVLDRLSYVRGYRLGGTGEGEWGATIVILFSEDSRDSGDSGGALP